MKIIFEIVCFPVTMLIWIISGLVILPFVISMYSGYKNKTKSWVDLWWDFNVLVYKTYIVEQYLDLPAFVRAIGCAYLYYQIFY